MLRVPQRRHKKRLAGAGINVAAICPIRSINADQVAAGLDHLTAQSGAPANARFDNGPEFVARAIADCCRFNNTNSIFIDPGSPWQNAWIESFTAGCATTAQVTAIRLAPRSPSDR